MNRLKRTATLLTLLGLMLMSKAWGQDNGSSAVALITPEGIFDIIYDKDGNQYNLSDLEIITPSSPLKNIKPLSVSSTTCSGGYFNLYFEIGSGMDGSSAIEIARRNVICQLFSDISTFINSPLTSSGGKVIRHNS